MSTISSDLNCLALIGVEDFYRRIKPEANDKQRLLAGKIMVAVAGVLCVAVALLLATSASTALNLYFTVTSVVAGGLFGVFFLAFMCPRANLRGVWIGIVACLLFTAYATLTSGKTPVVNLGSWNFTWSNILIGVIGHVLVIVCGYLGSWLFPPPDGETRAMTYWGWRDRQARLARDGTHD
jgi:SSS family solute:Na+ symporter